MEVVACVIIISGFLFLGARIFIKLRGIASWKSEDDSEAQGSAGPLPSNLRELRIEEPKGEPDSLDGIDETKSEQT